jgi:hypothetical protein
MPPPESPSGSAPPPPGDRASLPRGARPRRTLAGRLLGVAAIPGAVAAGWWLWFSGPPPVENIPRGLRWISNLVQARYYIVVVRDAMLQHGGWPAVWWAVAGIGLIGLGFYGLAWLRMRRMQLAP